ncbi:MAG: sodium:alanine symporter family protein [Proteobacteria bacterium]|nr:sodium:alanine symporter family protein [Pseudomonadota bacterium]
MDALSSFFITLDGYLGSAVYFPWVLLGVGAFFTLYLGFPQIRYFRRAWGVLRGHHSRGDAEGDTSHFQALSTALAGTVGTGNIGGVAFAIYLGGPAALFWMWATAFLGMTTKFVEVTVSHKYRVKDDQGRIAGGPMYFMERGLNMKWLAVFFAAATVLSTFGSGNMPQSNNMASGLEASFGLPTWLTGAVLAGLLALVIIGGIRRIAAVTSRIVPIMGALYAIGAFAVIVSNYQAVGPAFLSVFRDAFTGSAAGGGFLGATFAYAFNRGVNRGLFSNEAGQGSAPIAHAAARADEPVSEGMVSILEPFIDTLVICTLTGLVILSSGVWQEKFETDFQAFDTEFVQGPWSDRDPEHVEALFAHLSGQPPAGDPVVRANGRYRVEDGRLVGAELTVLHNRSVAEDVRFQLDGAAYSGVVQIEDGSLHSPVSMRGRSLLHSVPLTAEAFKRSFLGEFGQYAVTIGLVLFAFSTAIAWSYYGDRAMTYLFGTASVTPYRALYVVGFFLAAVMDTSLVWLLSATSLALMALPNLLGIVLLRRDMKSEIAAYWTHFGR